MQSTSERWRSLSLLVASCEKLFIANSRLDYYTSNESGTPAQRLRFRGLISDRISVLEQRVDHELDLLAARLLTASYEKKVGEDRHLASKRSA